VVISGTVTDASGRILSGQTVAAFWHSVRHARPLAVGLNCARRRGADAAVHRGTIGDRRHLRQRLSERRPAQPDVGHRIRRDAGGDLQPAREFAQSGFVNLAGGCCGTTPAHIAAIARAIEHVAPRQVPPRRR